MDILIRFIKLLLRHKAEIGAFFTFMGAAWFALMKFRKKIWKPAIVFWNRLIKALKELENDGGGSLVDKVKMLVKMVNEGVSAIEKMDININTILSRQEAMFNESPAAMFENDNEGVCINVNKAWVKFTGLPKDLATGHGYRRIIHPDDLKRLEQEGEDFRNDGNSYEGSFRMVHWISKDIINVRCTATKGYNSKHILSSIIGTLEEAE